MGSTFLTPLHATRFNSFSSKGPSTTEVSVGTDDVNVDGDDDDDDDDDDDVDDDDDDGIAID